MKVLLSPAKKLDFNSAEELVPKSTPEFLETADSLAGKLHKVSSKKLQSMMKLSDALTSLNKERYATWNAEQTEKSKKQAVLAFNGDVYLGLDAKTWSKTELEHSQGIIRILSGLYGILKPLDEIKPYRLEMGSKWQITAAKPNLYKFWGKQIAGHLESEMTIEEPIINLASAEYNRVILPHISPERRVVTAEFREFRNGEYKMIQVFVKKARGMMAKFIVQEKITDIKNLMLFNSDGYAFDANLSSENKLIFTR